jgi:formylglycine-generating enzyme required for sulfatase activity
MPEHVEKTVFISYRRTNIPWALAIFQDLTHHGFDVFFDYKGIASGDFEIRILENIQARAHFLVLLTPSALERCGNPQDWLRREIETALKIKRNIVPLMLEGFNFSTPGIAGQLTGVLAPLKRYNALNIPPEYFSEAMDRLRNEYLNVPLDAVLHSASPVARKAAKEQQSAAATARTVPKKMLTKQQSFERRFQETKDKNTLWTRFQTIIENLWARCRALNFGWLKDVNWIAVVVWATIIAAISYGGFSLINYSQKMNISTLWQRARHYSVEVVRSNPQQRLASSEKNKVANMPDPNQGLHKVAAVTKPRSVALQIVKNTKDLAYYVHLPAGQFPMGCSSDDADCYRDEKPAHQVTVSAFWIGQTEITQDSYDYVMPGKNRSHFNNDLQAPVENLSWGDAEAYCEAVGMRLPTEAEWEYAVRAGTSASRYGRLDEIGWHSGISGGETHPVQKKMANPWGLYDMLGNAWEWVLDWYGPYGRDPVKDPRGPPTGTMRIVRGGSCCLRETSGRAERASNRYRLPPKKSLNAIVGARCAGEALPSP